MLGECSLYLLNDYEFLIITENMFENEKIVHKNCPVNLYLLIYQ